MKLYEGISTGIAAILQEKMRSVLTMVGIIIGVAAVLAMLAVGDGAKAIVTQEFEKFGGHFTVRRNPWIWRGDRVFPNRSSEQLRYEDVLAIEAECPSVECAIPIVSSPVLAQAEAGATKWTECEGVNSYFPTGMAWKIQQGRFFSKDEFNNRRKVCVLGLEVATELFGDQNPIGKEIKLSLQGGRPDRFRILGVMGERGTSLQYGFSWDDIVYVPLTTAQDRFKGTHYVNYINVRAVDSDSIEKTAEEVKVVLRKRHRNQDDFFDISFATAAVKELDKISRILTIMLSSIAGFSLFVGSVGIMNMMLVSVNQRTREIGLRRAIGAKRRDIFLQFLVEAVVMCGVGGVLGILLGIGTGYLCSHIAVKVVKVIPHWPVVISLHWMTVSVSISACIGILFGLYPALRASHISPIEALRTE